MLTNLILTIIASLFALISLVFLVIGIVKKKQTTWVIALFALIGFSCFGVYSIYQFAKSSLDYAKSDDFKDHVGNGAKEIGEIIGEAASGGAEGLSSTLDEEAIDQLARKGGRIFGDGIRAISDGIDESMVKTIVYMDQSLSTSGIIIGRAETEYDKELIKKINLFIEYTKEFSGKLTLTSYDSEGLKTDFTYIEITAIKDTKRTESFTLYNKAAGDNGYCILAMESLQILNSFGLNLRNKLT